MSEDTISYIKDKAVSILSYIVIAGIVTMILAPNVIINMSVSEKDTMDSIKTDAINTYEVIINY